MGKTKAAYKPFHKNMTWAGETYAENGVYERDIKRNDVPKKGFFGYSYPLDCFRHKRPGDQAVYRRVEHSGIIVKQITNSRETISSTVLKVGIKLGISGLISAAMGHIMLHVKEEHKHAKGLSVGDYMGARADAQEGGMVKAGSHGVAVSNDKGISISEDYGAALAGKSSIAITGESGASSAGERGIAITGEYGASSAGKYGVSVVGYSGVTETGDFGVSVTNSFGAASSGYCGISIGRSHTVANAGRRGLSVVENGTATAGICGTAIAQDYGNATAGDIGIAVVNSMPGEKPGTAAAGSDGLAVAKDAGKASAGCLGMAIAGLEGHAMAGEGGTAISEGKSESGEDGVSIACSPFAMVKGGLGSVLVIVDKTTKPASVKTAIVGNGGIKPDTWYCLDNDGNFTEAAKEKGEGNGREKI